MTVWQVIDDTKIRHVWRCAECNEQIDIQPWWYQDNGTPVCETCGDDMKYLCTESNHA